MDEEETGRTAVARSADTIQLKVPHWLWDRRIPLGHMTLLAGREGIGKSSVGLQIAAQLTKGHLPGKFEGLPKSVGIVATEDDWSATIAPRLIAAGADLSRCYQIEAQEGGRLETVSVPDDIDSLGPLCIEREIALLIIDPVMSVLPGRIDTHKDREVRRALDPMTKGFAQKYGVAVVGLIHSNKGESRDALNTIMGSRAFTAVSRSVLFCAADPEDESAYVMGHIKSNLGPKMETLSYRLVEVKVEIPDAEEPDDAIAVVSRAIFGDSDDRNMSEILEAAQDKGRPQGGVANAIQEFIEETSGVVTREQIHKHFHDMKPVNLDMTLTRLVKRGRVDRPAAGVYQGIKLRANTPTNTSSNSSLVVSSVSDVRKGLTELTTLTSNSGRELVSPDVNPDQWPVVPPPDDWDAPPEWD